MLHAYVLTAGRAYLQVKGDQEEQEESGWSRDGDAEPEAPHREPAHHGGEREATGEGRRTPPGEPRAVCKPVQDSGSGATAAG